MTTDLPGVPAFSPPATQVGGVPHPAPSALKRVLSTLLGPRGYRALRQAQWAAATEWRDPGAALQGVHVLFVSQHDLPPSGLQPRDFLRWVPMVAVTRGWRGAQLLTRDATHDVPGYPRPEVDPTGAGDVFAAAFMVRYQETGDALEAAAFANCAASCAVEGVGASSLGDRAEIERRLEARRRQIEEGEEWDE